MERRSWRRIHTLLLSSFLFASALLFGAGLKQKESSDIINLLITLSATMAGFGLVAFQVAKASNELKNDFIDSSILMILSTISGFFYLVYPQANFLALNFGEVCIFIFLWAFILFLFILIDKRFNILN